jgi:hypothetical protein
MAAMTLGMVELLQTDCPISTLGLLPFVSETRVHSFSHLIPLNRCPYTAEPIEQKTQTATRLASYWPRETL